MKQKFHPLVIAYVFMQIVSFFAAVAQAYLLLTLGHQRSLWFYHWLLVAGLFGLCTQSSVYLLDLIKSKRRPVATVPVARVL